MAHLTLQIRGVIIACCILYNNSWSEIEQKTGVKADTVQHLMNILVEHAGNRDLNDILVVAALLPRSRHPSTVVDGTEESRALQELAYANPKFKLNELGISLVRSTIERIMYPHNNCHGSESRP
jgi:hypothetical protein